MFRLYRQQILPGATLECAAPEEWGLRTGDLVVCQWEKTLEAGRIQGECDEEPAETLDAWEERRRLQSIRRLEGTKLPVALRRASQEDLRTIRDNERIATGLLPKIQERVRANHLDNMHLTALHLTLDAKVLLCLYVAEGRVDFRALLKDLNAMLPYRLEMRQISHPQEASILGGIGVCGRTLCCHSFLSLKVASARPTQQLPASKIGLCGDPRCCLRFEIPDSPRRPPHQP